jgi:3-methyl-2-oxobutanoate hydroxymethyltransferase
VNLLGGFRMQGKTAAAARRILEDALLLQKAGCFGLVLESIPTRLAGLISERLDIPTIGIGAGAHCDGQVLVAHDVLGLFERFTPRFARQYRNLFGEMEKAFEEYIQDVTERDFPADEHSADMADEEWEAFLESVEKLEWLKPIS